MSRAVDARACTLIVRRDSKTMHTPPSRRSAWADATREIKNFKGNTYARRGWTETPRPMVSRRLTERGVFRRCSAARVGSERAEGREGQECSWRAHRRSYNGVRIHHLQGEERGEPAPSAHLQKFDTTLDLRSAAAVAMCAKRQSVRSGGRAMFIAHLMECALAVSAQGRESGGSTLAQTRRRWTARRCCADVGLVGAVRECWYYRALTEKVTRGMVDRQSRRSN
ncbi:hypothetical protein HYPSUDRAFT_1025979 [Hypholoma sublateritium FD-334 SS-4]|uniref:Uncharacterized protein n=1 Tax=Hypholoma sublateritium (strain FD-334 SS-4) TaxID=945553 RepID=A0A0D2NL16_HYPSF|nr:hypothetical protein HYPSUDRAFT_1025979 [Hypholoma sublateritium FD-334 SS-4]